jgi:hypothetical protein
MWTLVPYSPERHQLAAPTSVFSTILPVKSLLSIREGRLHLARPQPMQGLMSLAYRRSQAPRCSFGAYAGTGANDLVTVALRSLFPSLAVVPRE